MLIDFFLKLKRAGVPVTLMEFLTLLEALEKRLVFGSAEDFYYLARLSLVKDETNFDKFDRVFMEYFRGASYQSGDLIGGIPEEWLRKLQEKLLSEEEKRQIKAMGGWTSSWRPSKSVTRSKRRGIRVGKRTGHFLRLDDMKMPGRMEQVRAICRQSGITPQNADEQIHELLQERMRRGIYW